MISNVSHGGTRVEGLTTLDPFIHGNGVLSVENTEERRDLVLLERATKGGSKSCRQIQALVQASNSGNESIS